MSYTRRRLTILAIIITAAAAQTAAEAQDTPPDYGPDVLVLSTPVLAAFEKGLRTEIALRAQLKKEIATLDATQKTPEQYRKCQGEAVMSPESMKIAESMMDIPENATMGQRQRRMERMGLRLEASVLKKCGPEPQRYARDQWVAKRLVEIEQSAADAAGPIP